MVTPAQARAAVKKHKTKSAAARALGVTRNALRWALSDSSAEKASPGEKAALARVAALEKQLTAERAAKVARLPKARKHATRSTITRVVIPDSHGAHISWPAAKAMIADIRQLSPDEIVWLGDHLDCAGTFSAHQRSYTNELAESYEEDITQANALIDLVMQAAPNARHHYLEGNHEAHVERWAARNFPSFRDARLVVERLGPEGVLRLRERDIAYYRRSESYQDLPIPGTIKLGKCYFTHGISHSKHATTTHVERFGASVVHGHTHRAAAVIQRTVESVSIGSWCPGTLAKLQPLYKHTSPTDWSHGYMVQFVDAKTGKFVSFCVPIFGDHTLLMSAIRAVQQ